MSVDYEAEPYFKKYRRFFAHSQGCRSIVACLRCGSTAADMGAPGFAKCHSCDNEMKWDESKFGIVRIYGWNERLKPSQVSDMFHLLKLKKLGEL